ncbi:MAG: CDP-alcohol phosphatidyltransferase family protein [Methylobacteriaceae bacterium]|nr:CDP-alcohol phosphatidyltransferase family protein [Methylobacteriaceae bacterium]MBV9636532.1 CDP-alcohol phosphatidyltransferase family protein [Methylobacteriaceae bacterium]MBV9703381.1 CDP-alcohol phosphatidyltransferase family protein [Methylobacteriaceae bacterium]
MTSIYDLKPRFQNLLRPVCRRLAAIGISANAVTLAALLLSLAHGAWIASRPHSRVPLLCLPITLFIRMALNAIDGMLAREHGMKSRLGALLNEVGDVVSDAALYLPLALVPGLSASLIVVAVALGIIGEMTGALGPTVGASRRYDGPMGKSDRAAVFGLLAVLIGGGLPAGLWSTIFVSAVVALAGATIFNRARGALAEGREA